MKKSQGFSSFEFYVVMAAIGLILLLGIQRYNRLAEQTQRFGFEIIAQHFSESVYNLRAQWIIFSKGTVNHLSANQKQINDVKFSEQGWPLSFRQDQEQQLVNISGCLYLWNTLLHNPPAISYSSGDAYGTRPYHLTVTDSQECKFEFISDVPSAYYFTYDPFTGHIHTFTPASAKNN